MSASFLPDLTAAVIASGTATGVKVPQGAVISPGVLDVVFMNAEGNYISPYELSYSISAISGNGAEVYIGSRTRRPYEVRTGRFSPNMQIGDTWFTGTYSINWAYKIKGTDTVSIRSIGFEVVSAGVYDVRLVGLGLFNVKATVIVVE